MCEREGVSVEHSECLEIDVDVQIALDDMTEVQATEIVTSVCTEIANREDLAHAYVSVTIVDESQIRVLNRDYRARDAVTDVLSFALLEGDEEPGVADSAEAEPQCLGDIVICWERVKAQAADYGHSIARELAFLTAHGMLHLLGYDHGDEESERAMFAVQEDVLQALSFTREA